MSYSKKYINNWSFKIHYTNFSFTYYNLWLFVTVAFKNTQLQIQRDIKQNAETQNIHFQLETRGANLIFFDSESYYYSTMFYKYQKNI